MCRLWAPVCSPVPKLSSTPVPCGTVADEPVVGVVINIDAVAVHIVELEDLILEDGWRPWLTIGSAILISARSLTITTPVIASPMLTTNPLQARIGRIPRPFLAGGALRPCAVACKGGSVVSIAQPVPQGGIFHAIASSTLPASSAQCARQGRISAGYLTPTSTRE